MTRIERESREALAAGERVLSELTQTRAQVEVLLRVQGHATRGRFARWAGVRAQAMVKHGGSYGKAPEISKTQARVEALP